MRKVNINNNLTPFQRRIIFAELGATAFAIGEDKEQYRKRVMRETVGVDHLSEVTRTDGFDRMMCRILQDRGDYQRASEYILGGLARLRYLIREAAAKIVAAKSYRGSAYDYIAGVMIQNGMLPSYTSRSSAAEKLMHEAGWADFTDRQVKLVLIILQKEVSRLKR